MLGNIAEPDAAANGPNGMVVPGRGTTGLTYCVTHSTVRAMGDTDAFGKLELELRRGVVVLATLSQLRAPRYGYELRQALADKGMPIEEGTLYPLLRRLETQGLLVSEWREENKRNKRFYRLSPAGEIILGQLLSEWQRINASLTRIVDEA